MSLAVRILVADPNTLTRLGIVTMLRTEAGFDVVGEAADGARAVASYEQLAPDVLVSELKLPVLDGVQVTAQVCRRDPAARVLILTHDHSPEDVFQALRAGARGYVTKECGREELLSAVRTVAAGARHVDVEVASRLADRATTRSLTGREQEVLALIAAGLTNPRIGERLAISTRTAGAHVRNILEKLDAHTRTEAVAVATRRGLLRRP